MAALCKNRCFLTVPPAQVSRRATTASVRTGARTCPGQNGGALYRIGRSTCPVRGRICTPCWASHPRPAPPRSPVPTAVGYVRCTRTRRRPRRIRLSCALSRRLTWSCATQPGGRSTTRTAHGRRLRPVFRAMFQCPSASAPGLRRQRTGSGRGRCGSSPCLPDEFRSRACTAASLQLASQVSGVVLLDLEPLRRIATVVDHERSGSRC
jgi:hypothetical protein